MATASQTRVCFSLIPAWQKRQSPVVRVNVLWSISIFIYIYFYLFLATVQCKILKPTWECRMWAFFSLLTTMQWYEDPSYLRFRSPEFDTAGCLADQFQLKEIPHSWVILWVYGKSWFISTCWRSLGFKTHTFWPGCWKVVTTSFSSMFWFELYMLGKLRTWLEN